MAWKLRPWGHLKWILDRLGGPNASLLGCFGTEKRSLATWDWLRSSIKLRTVQLLRISDSPGHRYEKLARKRIRERMSEFKKKGGKTSWIQPFGLMETPHSQIVEIVDDFIRSSGDTIVLDVSAMPKRFFFPILKTLLARKQVQNLLVSYSLPGSYIVGAKLGEDHNGWEAIPLFAGDYSSIGSDMYVIGVGFEEHGLLEQLQQEDGGKSIKLLFPFPARPENVRRSWRLVYKIERTRPPEAIEMFQVDAQDSADAFERLTTLTDNGRKKAILAPFGPKPMSVGMCLFAARSNCAVYYTQPTVYHPDYSLDLATSDGIPLIFGYLIRWKGKEFYEIGPQP